MLVKALQFGSNWWARFGHDPNDRYRFTRRAAYYNSSGVQCGSKMRRHWVIPGLIRFNGVSDFNPNYRSRMIGQILDCSELNYASGGNRLLFHRRVRGATVPDYYLVVVSSDRFGIFDFQSPTWKAADVEVIAASHLRNPQGIRQEALVLMPPNGWLESSVGTWRLWLGSEFPCGAALQIGDE